MLDKVRAGDRRDSTVSIGHQNGNVAYNGARAEQALRASELSYRRLFESAKDGILILDFATGCITDANPFLCKLLGFSLPEMLGQTVGELSPFKDIVTNQAMFKLLQDHGYVRYEDLPLETKDGRKIAVEFVSNVYQAGDKQVIQCNVRDITERKHTEEALRDSDATQLSILNALPAQVALIDNEGVIVSVNEAWRRFAVANALKDANFGVGQNYLDVCEHAIGTWSENAQAVAIGIHRVLRGETEDFTMEYPCHSPTVQRWFLLRVVPMGEDSSAGAVVMHVNITERKLAEETLRYSESSMAAAQRIAHVGSWEMELTSSTAHDANPVHWSDELFRIAGYEPGGVDPSVSLVFQLVPEDEHALMRDAIADAIALHKPYSIVHRLIQPNGEERVLHEAAQVFFDEKTGQPLKMVGTTQDITERNKIEKQLLWKTAFFEAQVHSALDGILIVDSKGDKIIQNQRMAELWNIAPEFAGDVDDRRQLEWVTKQVANPTQFAEKIVYLQAHPREISRDEIELVDGRIFDRYSAPVQDVDGKYYGRIWSFRDISKLKRAESRFRRLVDSNAQGVIFWNTKGEITGANDAFLCLGGFTRDDLEAGRINWLAMTPPEYAEVDRRCLEKVAATGVCAPYEKEYIRKDGSRVQVLIGVASFEDSPEEGVCFVADLSESKKLERQLLRAQRMESIGTLAGGIAHDLNNILAPILMSIDILKSDSDSPETTKILETIEVSAKRGADIVRQVLSFARGMEGERIEVQPTHLLKDLGSIIKNTFPKDIRLQFSIPNDTWTILGDPTQVQQILMNLCVNARDAMPHGGILSVGVENCVLDEQYAAMNLQAKPGRYVVISVTDSGTGMAPKILDKIFEPFFTTKELSKGTGLGLSTVLAIVKSHEGIINVYSEPGKGTTFRVYLPAMELSSEALAKQIVPISPPRGNGETILVVDDEASIRTITSQTLQAFGYHVLTATDGADAVSVYAEHKNEIAVVLTDMMMPLMDGTATIHALMRINPAIKIVAASGLATDGSAAKVFADGVKHFLTKPYTAGTLLKTMRAILDET